MTEPATIEELVAKVEPQGAIDGFYARATPDWQRNEWTGQDHPYAALSSAVRSFLQADAHQSRGEM